MVKISGGDKLAKALAEISKKVESGGTLSVGFLSGATGTDGGSIPLRAAVNEYGAPAKGIPPRPFFRNMIAAHSKEWPEVLGHALAATNYDAARALELTGDTIKAELRQSIKDTNSPPNAPSTIKKKGFDAPLRDTRDMFNAVDSEVTDDEI